MKFVCAWCEPHNKDPKATHGICALHVFAQALEIGLYIEQVERQNEKQACDELEDATRAIKRARYLCQ